MNLYQLIFFPVCDYFVHETCMEFAVPNCLESATYDPAKSLSDARNGTTHHFQVRGCSLITSHQKGFALLLCKLTGVKQFTNGS